MGKKISTLPKFTGIRSDMLIPVIDLLRGSAGSGYATVHDCLLVANSAVFNILDFGGNGDGVTDNYAAVLLALAAAPQIIGNPTLKQAVEIKFPPGNYRMSQNLILSQAVKLTGQVGAGWIPGASLIFDAGKHGITATSTSTTGVVLEGLAILSAGGSTGPGSTIGVRMIRRVVMYRCRVAGFSYDGVNIDADSASSGGAQNANCWHVQDCLIDTNGRHGIYTHGGDSNAGLAIGNSISSNLGCGVYENSFLGNTYIGNHAELNTGNAYFALGAVNNSVFSGNYSESGQPFNDLSGAPQSIWYSGASHGFIAGTPRIHQNKTYNIGIGSEAWILGGLQGTWVNAGGINSVAAHRLDSTGITHVKGMVQGGGAGTSVMVMSTVRAPAENQTFLVPSNGGVAVIIMQSNGSLYMQSNSGVANGWIALDGIHFTASSFAGAS